MNVVYGFKVVNKIMQISLKTTDLGDYNFVSTQTFNSDDLKKVGNIIDKNTFPFRWCYILLKQFQDEVNKRLMLAASLIDDEDLKNSIVNYGKAVMKSEVTIVPPEKFEKLVKEVQEYVATV